MKLDRLDIVCDPRHGYPLFQSPFGVDVDGDRYAVATTGSVLVAIKADFELTTLDTRSVPSRISEWSRLVRANGKRINLSSLRVWAGTKTEPESCEKCGGAREITCRLCKGRRWVECECLGCGDLHDVECDECTDGKEPCPECTSGGHIPVKLGKINGWLFNSELVARALAIIESDTALFWLQACGDHGILYLGETNWLVVIMGMRHRDGNEKRPIPTWSSEEAIAS